MDEYLTTLAKIYEMNIVKKEPVWFTKLVESLNGVLSRGQISRSLDRLYDVGAINTGQEKHDDKFIITITVSSGSETLAKEMYEKL